MSGTTSWNRLVRYVSKADGNIKYGEPIVEGKNPDIDALALRGGLKVKVLQGSSPFDAAATGEEDEIASILGPLVPKDVPFIRCIGINYKTHIAEIGFDQPENPTVFAKPRTCIADTRQPVPIPKLGQQQCDYEGELCIIVGKTGKDISVDDALDYVAGYASGNDVSCRDWQMEKTKAGFQPQWCFSKSFDKYAPIGPAIVSTKVLGDAKGLDLKTIVNGEVRQSSNTSDLCFGVREIVSFLSTGQTLEKGTVIMTGTPGGVGLGMKPQTWLKDGDEVIVEIEGIGKLVNVIKYQ